MHQLNDILNDMIFLFIWGEKTHVILNFFFAFTCIIKNPSMDERIHSFYEKKPHATSI